jgi:ATP-binding cassette subfamily D (ALD) protein 3
MVGYWLISRPVFDPRYATEFMGKIDSDPTQIMEDYSRNSSYLINLSQAIGKVILSGRELTRFTGYAARVAEFFEVLDDVGKGHYQRTMTDNSKSMDLSVSGLNKIDLNSLNGHTEINNSGEITFKAVPIITPNGDVLVKSLSCNIKPGMNCLITGPNGCGKSSFFRILGDLWPLFDGTLSKPPPHELFYVPQKPYLVMGTFRDQIIYPNSLEESVNRRGNNDEKLLELLKVVQLDYLLDREGGWNSVRDWQDVLSGGEKQRVAMARLFYHKPIFAILDECTSAVSIDVEG